MFTRKGGCVAWKRGKEGQVRVKAGHIIYCCVVSGDEVISAAAVYVIMGA